MISALSAILTGPALQPSWTGKYQLRRKDLSLSSRDNANGGSNGPETVTLLNSLTNSQYDYLVAINDFDFNNNGEDFYSSMSSINIINQLQSEDIKMVGNSTSSAEDFYFFGCLKISTGMNLS